MRTFLIVTAATACFCFVYGSLLAQEQQGTKQRETHRPAESTTADGVDEASTSTAIMNARRSESKSTKPNKLAPFVTKGINWLIEAQNDSGGWGGGSHANQQERDPHKVKTDPATTSFATLALIRAGSTLHTGPHQKQVRSAVEYLVKAVEQADDEGPRITDLQGTQPQTKLGGLVDTTMTTQCLARCLKDTSKSHELYARINKALDKCIAKLEKAQKADGSWNVAGGWAPVLQSSSGLQALELAQASGKRVAEGSITRARAFQKRSIDTSGRKAAGLGGGGGRGGGGGGAVYFGDAGVELYSFATAQRGNAVDAAECEEAITVAKAEGKLNKDAPVSVDNLRKIGFQEDKAKTLKEAFDRNENQIKRLGDEKLLKGFGNNGGEEFVSFLLTSESMIIAGGDKWEKWNDKMHGLMQKIQNNDGSWSGHHCITSPVFCTAAVLQCLTVEGDSEMLREIAKTSARNKEAAAAAKAEEETAAEKDSKNSETAETSEETKSNSRDTESKAESKSESDSAIESETRDDKKSSGGF